MDTIRKAEESSREAARRGMERARAGWEDTGRILRRKMRLNWREEEHSTGNQHQPEPIVSIHGKDVMKGGRRIA